MLLGWRRVDAAAVVDDDEQADASPEWDSSHVQKMWLQVYPDGPPDFLGDPNDFSRERDEPSMRATQRLSRSVPKPYKQMLKPLLGPHGFKGFRISELTPNKTRRAQAVNWILYWYHVHYPDYEWYFCEKDDSSG